ncbi:MAG: PHP domain-containing protein [Clostridiales bacterium]|nr:PHP domain-containing protein [Clostridiales bacterium]
MLLFGDYHTHSIYSRHNHGKGTVLENASVAADKGLKQIAITDHGFNHQAFGIKRKNIPQLHEDIMNAKEITGVDILLGVESNIISLDGHIDIKEEDYEFLDILLMGYHRLVRTNTLKDSVLLHWSNIYDKAFKPSKERINRNTTAFLKTLDKHPIDVITHLNYGFQTDTIAVAKMAKQKGVYVELNGKRINFTEEEIEIMAAEGVKFILNSDAHRPEKVGEVNNGMNLVYKLNIPTAQVVNVDKLPKFHKKRGN